MIHINDPIHGCMTFPDVFKNLIDHPLFQRSRQIYQLGLCHYVFPSATHTRFSHSLGVAYLAMKLGKKLNCTDRECILLGIAGLYHDFHLPFSHLFEEYLQKKGYNLRHEELSVKMTKLVLTQNQFSDDDIQFVCNCIDPPPYLNSYKYQIVSGKSIDVDRLDYMARDSFYLGLQRKLDFERFFNSIMVIDDEIVFSAKDRDYINYNFILLRQQLHSVAYQHKATKKMEYHMMKCLDYLVNWVEIPVVQDSIASSLNILDVCISQNLDGLLHFTDTWVLSKLSCPDVGPYLAFSEYSRIVNRQLTHTIGILDLPYVPNIMTLRDMFSRELEYIDEDRLDIVVAKLDIGLKDNAVAFYDEGDRLIIPIKNDCVIYRVFIFYDSTKNIDTLKERFPFILKMNGLT